MSEALTGLVIDSEEARFAAMTANDLGRLESLLEDDLHYVHSNAIVEDKREFLRKIRSGERRFRRFAGRARETRHEGGFTFVFGEAEVEVDTTAGFVQSVLIYTAIYRNSEMPRLLAWHAVKKPAGLRAESESMSNAHAGSKPWALGEE